MSNPSISLTNIPSKAFHYGTIVTVIPNKTELKIEGEWTETSTSEMFLIHDSGAESRSRVVVFASDTRLRHLARQRVWYMDGNFSLAPKIFQQVYIIRAKLGDTAVTCAYGLLPGKSKEI